jgi:putative DNA primase/helicase
MKGDPDINDIHCARGVEGVREEHDKARKYNDGDGPSKKAKANDQKITRPATPTIKDAPRPPPPSLSDDALALRFADLHVEDRRYIAFTSRWMRWTGLRWEKDTTLNTFDAIRVICRQAAVSCKRKEKAVRLASAGTIAAVEKIAKSDQRLAAIIEQFDAGPNAFGALEMTIDLKAGVAYAPRREDYITKTASVAPAPEGTPCPLWEAFLTRVTAGNAELNGFLQRYCGYCMTGHVNEHVFAFLHGTGANGKSTFINTVAGIFGDYATVVPMELFMGRESDRHPTEKAKLLGARLAIGHETQRGRRWDEATIKKLTGGDKVTARFMRQDFFDFDPTHKFLIAGNHKPNLSSVDEAMRRRLLLVPFTVQIPEPERDTELPEKLKAEWPAILQWAVDGCLEWRKFGLMVPAIVREASEAYFAEQDTIGQWIEECIVGDVDAFTRTLDLFASWKTWTEAKNHRPGSERAFVQALVEHKLQKGQHSRTRQSGFWCVRVRDPEQTELNMG